MNVVYTARPNVEQARWIIDHQMVRGINLVFMSASSTRPPREGAPAATPAAQAGTGGGSRGPRFFMQPEFLPVVESVNRVSCLLARGRPAAKIGLYYPTTSMWLGDNDSNASVLAIAQKLLVPGAYSSASSARMSSSLAASTARLTSSRRSGQG